MFIPVLQCLLGHVYYTGTCLDSSFFKHAILCDLHSDYYPLPFLSLQMNHCCNLSLRNNIYREIATIPIPKPDTAFPDAQKSRVSIFIFY